MAVKTSNQHDIGQTGEGSAPHMYIPAGIQLKTVEMVEIEPESGKVTSHLGHPPRGELVLKHRPVPRRRVAIKHVVPVDPGPDKLGVRACVRQCADRMGHAQPPTATHSRAPCKVQSVTGVQGE